MGTEPADHVELDANLARVGLARWTPVPVLKMDNTEHVSRVQPFLWKWSDIENGLMQVSELADATKKNGKAPRRLVRLVNPSTNSNWPSVTSTLGCNVTLLNPGERWHAHRHVAEAIRFSIKGSGEFVIGNERCVMEAGDLAFTPSLMHHEHSNVGMKDHAIWIDALNVGIVRAFEVPFYEEFEDETLPIDHTSKETTARYGAPGFKADWLPDSGPRPRLLHYTWKATYDALKQLSASDASPYDDVMLEYVEPGTDRSPLRTIGCFIQLIRPNVSTLAHRQTSSGMFYCHAGHGTSIVGGQRIEWKTGDFFVVPPWTWHEHANHRDEEAILFSMQDTPVYKALGLYHEEPHPSQHQVADGRRRPTTLNDVWSR
jgi:gentisate 1,2-dioxygenase